MSNEDARHPSPSEKSIEAFRDSILESFSEVRDPRILEPSIRHELDHILSPIRIRSATNEAS